MRSNQQHQLPPLTDTDGQPFKTESLKGKVLIVSYFQTWCGDCVKEQPELMKLQERFTSDSLAILMISDEPIELIKTFKTQFQSGLNFYHSQKGLKKELGIRAFPTTFLLDKKGKEIIKKVEGINWYTPEIISKISQLLKE